MYRKIISNKNNYKFTYANPWMFNTWVHTKICKKSRYMDTYNNFEKIQDTYTNFEKIQQKQSFHHRLTIL